MTDYTSWNGLLQTANEATGNMFGAVLPFTLWLIIFGATSAYGWSRAFFTASFIAFIASLALFALEITSGYIMVVLLVLTLVGFFFLMRG